MSALAPDQRRVSPPRSAALKVHEKALAIRASSEDLQTWEVGLELERLADAVAELAAIVARMAERQR